MSWWRTEVNRLREENEAVKNLASALHERLWEVESERDEWQDRYRDLQSEYARQSQAWSEQRAYYEDRLARAEHRRAAAVARADQLRDERDDALSAGLEALGDAERDRDEAVARAEAAEARTAPAVTRDDIEKAIRGKTWAANREPNKAGFHRVHIAWATDSVWSLVSGADPAVHVVRESDVAAVEVTRDFGGWYADGAWLASADETAEWVRDRAAEMVVCAARNEAAARAIEQDAATDPIADAIRDGLNVWGTTDEGVRQIAESIRRAISNDGGENVL